MKRSDIRTAVIAGAVALVGANAPAIAHGVHAAFAHNADKVDGIHAVKAGAVNKNKKLVATDATGKFPASVIPALAPSAHTHDAGDLASGTIADARIADNIARDSEIMSTVLANDGSGSGLNADLVDGKDSNDLETTYRYEDENETTKLDIDANPVLCQVPSYAADAGDVAHLSGDVTVGTTGAGNVSYSVRPVSSDDAGANWDAMATNLSRETTSQNGWSNATTFGEGSLAASTNYLFGLEVRRDTTSGYPATTVDPTHLRCHILVEINEDA